MLPVVILAGGLATRMMPITEKIPKSLIEVAGKPFIIHQLEYLKAQGVGKIVICLGHFGEMIQALVGDGSRFGLNIEYSFDGALLLGTGGAIKKSLHLLPKDFFVVYGDSFLPINYKNIEDAYFSTKRDSFLVVIKNNNLWDKSNVDFEFGKIVEYNKKNPRIGMQYIDYGLSILNQSVFNDYSYSDLFSLAEVYNKLSMANKLDGYEVRERFYEIGSKEGLEETRTYLSRI